MSNSLPAGWEIRQSKSRNIPYYYNPATKESRWEPPTSSNDSETKDPSDSGKIRASHLLVKWEGSRRPSSWKENNITRSKDEALALIESYARRLKSNEVSFADLAKTESDCGSAKAGGDLGFFGPKQMQLQFEEAAYALSVGEMSGPVWSDSGVHLILRTA